MTGAAPDLERVADALERAFPEAGAIRPLRRLGRGFRSDAVESAGGMVFRIGRSPEAAADYAREWRMRAFLAEGLGALVPEARWYAPPSADFPHGAIGYRKLPGETPAWGADAGAPFARDLGSFMARLHGLPLAGAREAGVREVDSYTRLLGARGVVMPVLRARLDVGAVERVEAWWSALGEDGRMRSGRVAVCHHDLWHDNVLRSEEGRLSGVLDLAHVEVGDPAHDFAAPGYFGEAFLEELVASYRAAGGRFDGEEAYRARRFHEGRELGGLAWAVEHEDAGEVDEALGKIARGPIVAGG